MAKTAVFATFIVWQWISLVMKCSAAPTISYISSPAWPDETVVLAGGGFSSDCVIVLTALSTNHTTIIPIISEQTTESSIKFILPAEMAIDAFSVSVRDASGGTSPLRHLNIADPWWCQGNAGDAATPSGWIRCFGKAISFVDERAEVVRQRLRYLRTVVVERGALDDPAGDDSLLATAAEEILSLRAQLSALPAAHSVLRLTRAGQPDIFLNAFAANSTSYSAQFAVPATAAPGSYTLALSNGLGKNVFVPLDSFASPASPHTTTIDILPAASWPEAVFTVTATSPPAQPPTATSDAAIAAALQAAAAAGGGTVVLAAGQFFLTRALFIPPRTRVVGAGTDLTAIYFAEATVATAPYAYFSLLSTGDVGPGAGKGRQAVGVTASSWGVSDLTVFITAYHNIVFDVSNKTDGFWLQRVRVRANAWFAQNGAYVSTRGRSLNVSSWEQLGPVLQLNARNFFVEDCDLLGSYNVITSQRLPAPGYPNCDHSTWPNNCHAAAYGLITRNKIFNGGAGHVMNQWSHVIFEFNQQQGISLMAMGQAIGTADGGYAAHIYLGDNDISGVFGNDREVMTFDCSGGLYYGGIAGVDGTVLTLAGDAWPADSMEWGGFAGGSVVIVNGTGTGQWRRIVVPGINSTATPSNRTWVLDRAFDVPPQPNDSLVQVLPFRGQNIWHRNSYRDAGAVQFYGHAISNLVSESYFTRFGGLIAWGQWRGWASPDEPNPPHHSSCGLFDGIQPNLQAEWVDNLVLEGLTVMNYNCTATDGTRGSACGEELYRGHSYVIQRPYFVANSSTPSPQTLLSIFRGNSGLSHSGFWIAASASNALVENSAFARSSNCVTVDDTYTDLIFQRGTTCSEASGRLEDNGASDAEAWARFLRDRTILRGPRL